MDPQLSLVCLDNDFKKPLNKVKKPFIQTTTKRPKLPDIDTSLLSCGKTFEEAPFPFQAQIKVLQDRVSKHVCSGAILTEKHILTSASCLVNNPLKHYIVVVGQNDLLELDEWEEEFSVQSIFTHDNYDDLSGENDIALVKLKKRRGNYIEFSDYVQPICLPFKNQENLDDFCEVSGWGSWNSDPDSTLSGQNVNLDLTCDLQGTICVENPSATSQRDFNFDDGMPLSCKSSQRSFLRGLHAKKIDPCQQGCPMMKFLEISDYLDWINARLAL